MSEGKSSPNVSEEEVKAEGVEKDMDESKDLESGDESPKKEEKEKVKRSEKKRTYDEVEIDEDDPHLGLLERPVVIESGKREKRKVERLEVRGSTPQEKKTFTIPEGSGEQLGQCPRIEYQLGKVKAEDLKIVHRALFDRPGYLSIIKKNIRKFNGFDFGKDDKRFEKKRAQLSKNTQSSLKKMCEVFDLEKNGTKEEVLTKLMDFMLNPKNSGKKIPVSKKKRKSGDVKAKKSTVKKTIKNKSSPKKKKLSDSDVESSDSDVESSKSSDSEKEADKADKADKVSEDSSSESEAEIKETPKKKKKVVEKKTPEKKTPKKEKKIEKKKKSTPKKPEKKVTPKKRKVVDSSDSSDDEPIMKKKKSAPSNDTIHDDVKKILEGANLEEVTMKTVIKQVYAKYPDFDLTPRKEFIKSTVKQIIS